MIRLVIFATGFFALSVALIVMSPGSVRTARELPDDDYVTRAGPTLTGEVSAVPRRALQPQPAPAQSVAVDSFSIVPSSAGEELDMRRMTWITLANLKRATGQGSTPGQPGSVLHMIVQRSISNGESITDVAPVEGPESGVYVVQEGDTLVSIAEMIYGDVNMTGPLFAANLAILKKPDDLRSGQILELPSM